ncbi:MAG: SpoIIE family protein phosphatase [Leptospiraceae bacterium]|nr:SpoIIE family protein phosphatase [Leptospiraceae bacterium]
MEPDLSKILKDENRFKQLIELIPAWITVLDKDRKIVYMNHPPAPETGLTMDDIIGLPIELTLQEYDKKSGMEALDKAKKSGTQTNYISGVPDGMEHYNVEIIPFGNEFLLVTTDISERVLHSRKREELIIELERSKNELLEAEKKIKSALTLIQNDLSVAQKIQTTLLPLDITEISNIKIFSKYIPMMEVGGDLFDIFELEDGTVRVFLADATGHGVRAALITMLIKSEYDNIKDKESKPSELLKSLNNTFSNKYLSLNYFFTCFIVDIHPKTKTLNYSSAGHSDQLFIKSGFGERLTKTGTLPGIKSNVDYKEFSYNFSENDKLILFTDGLFEEFNKDNELFGEEKLYEVICKNKEETPETIISICFQELEKFMGEIPVNDDITVIGIELG